jgi:pyridoxamine 5'-phosphate oxidase
MTKLSWQEKLELALSNHEHLPQVLYFQLATIRQDGRPANRTVVFRGFENSSLIFTTDQRSEKIAQLSQNAWAEACWYFPETREQFRLLGQCKIIHEQQEALRIKMWQTLSPASKQSFTWPASGQSLSSLESYQYPIPELLLDNFVLLLLQPIQVDILDLRPKPHQRRVFSLSKDLWAVEDVNP